jgi:23S rRNA (adenine2503-C2)-methyltransferase
MMPIAYKYSIEELITACKSYIEKTNRRVTFEYSLVKGVNDGSEQAEQLINLLRGILCHVNLIPINEIRENSYEKSTSDNVKAFYNKLTSFGIETTIRKEMGADINAACGQLRRSYLQGENEKKGV